MNSLRDVKTRNELAVFLGIPIKKLTHILYIKGVENLYASFTIPKKSGEERYINAPTDELKNIQKKTYYCFMDTPKGYLGGEEYTPKYISCIRKKQEYSYQFKNS